MWYNISITIIHILARKEYDMTLPKAKQLPSGRWRTQLILGKDDAGKRIVKSFTADTEDESVFMAVRYRAEHENESPKDDLTVSKAFELYIKSRNNILSPSTINGYEIIARSRLQHIMKIKCSALTIMDVQTAINLDSTTLSPKSIKSAVGLLKSVMSSQDIELPWKRLTLPQKRKSSETLPSVDIILQTVVGTEIELPCLLAMWCSMRISEIRGLKFSDLIDNGKYIRVQRARMYIEGKDVVREMTKTYESTRTIQLPPYVRALIYSIPHASDDEFIISLGYSTIYKKYANMMQQRGIQTTFHKLRHCFATTLNDLGIPSKYIQKLGGWSTDNVMKSVYTHTTDTVEQHYGNVIDTYFMDKLMVIEGHTDVTQ